MTVKVFFETPKGSYAEEIATFSDEEYFDACYPILEKIAKKNRFILTESFIEETKKEE
jgi:folate-dependent tRNA-U54 methylase TrmFO/GidA